VCVCVCVIK